MSTNLKNRSIALGATFALMVSSLVATAPAAYAAGEITLKPSAGTNLGAFITDDFEMDVEIPTGTPTTTLAVKIENPSKENLEIAIDNIALSSVTIRSYDALGNFVSLALSRVTAINAVDGNKTYSASNNTIDITSGTIERTTFKVDFDTESANRDITSVVLTDFLVGTPHAGNTDQELTIGVQVLKSTGAAFVYGDGNQGDVTVSAWSEISVNPNNADYGTVDAAYASAAATVKFIDPKGVSVIPSVKRYVGGDGSLFLNDLTNNAGLAGAVRFVNNDLNLAQIDLKNFDVSVKKADGTDAAASFSQVSLGTARITLAGTRENDDTAKAIHVQVGSTTLDTALVYNFQVVHTSDTSRKFNSVAFNPAAGNTDRALFVSVSDSVNASQTNTTPSSGLLNGVVDTSVTLRPGTAAFTYKSRLYDTDSADRAKVASQPVVALVTAGAYMPTGTSLSVSGSTETLTAAAQALTVVGLTNSDGDFSVTVTSSNPIAATGYTVQFFSLTDNSIFSSELTVSHG